MPFEIQKRSDELERLERLLDQVDAQVKRAFTDFLRRISDDTVIKAMADLVQAGRMTEALAIIGYEGASLGTAANAIFVGSAQTEAEALIATLRALAPNRAIAFNQFDDRLTAIARQTGIEFVQNITRTQQDSLADILSRNIGRDYRSVARSIRNSIGLTTKQISAAARYRSLLESGSKQALQYELRDRRFDGPINSGRQMTTAQIDRAVDRYMERQRQYRAEVIARTEGGALSGVAREAGFRQMIQQAGINASDCDHGWVTRRDMRVRDLHQPMDGVWETMDQQFVMPNGETCWRPHDPSLSAKNRAGCRCYQRFRIRARPA